MEQFIENEHIIDPESALGKDFSSKAKNMTANLTSSLTNSQAFEDIQYMIDDSKTPNAYVVLRFEKPILVFTKGLLKSLGNEDQMAYIL
jgi:hypothetical protein